MSTLGCICGHIIKDNKYPLSTEGKIICQEDSEQIFSLISKEIAQLFQAIMKGERNNWITQFFGAGYPLELENASVIHDIFLRLFEPTLVITQCESCGRLWVQEEPSATNYRPFKPESDWKGIIRGRIEKDSTDI